MQETERKKKEAYSHEIQNALEIMLKELSLNQSVKLISKIYKLKKNEIYDLALEIKKNDK